MKEYHGKPWTYWQKEGKWKFIIIKGSLIVSAAIILPQLVFILAKWNYSPETLDNHLRNVKFLPVFIAIFGPVLGWCEWHTVNRKHIKEQKLQ